MRAENFWFGGKRGKSATGERERWDQNLMCLSGKKSDGKNKHEEAHLGPVKTEGGNKASANTGRT